MLDVSKALRERNTLALSYAVTKLEPAKLANIPGLGIIQVVRTQDGDLLELIGTWRLENNEDSDAHELKHAYERQQSVRYEGRVSDPLQPDAVAVGVDIRILSIRSYAHTSDSRGTQEVLENPQTIKTFYRLAPVGSLPQELR